MGAALPPTKPETQGKKKSMRERVDPGLRSLDGVAASARVTRKSPHRFYLWANERPLSANAGGDVGFYTHIAEDLGLDASDGYIVETVQSDGPRVPGALSKTEGEPIVNSVGQVLLSCPAEFKKLVDSIGSDGQSGQEDADRIEKLMITKRGLADHLRGVGVAGRDGPFLDVEAQNEHGEMKPISLYSV